MLNEEVHRTLFEAMPQGVVYFDSDGRISSVNPAAERMLGLSRDQLLGAMPWDFIRSVIHEDGSNFPWKSLPSVRALRTGKPVRNVVVGLPKPGGDDCLWIRVDAIPEFKDGGKRPFRVFSIFADISARRKAEEEFERIFNLSPDMICIASPNGKFQRINPSFERVLGFTEADILRLGWAGLIHPDDMEPTRIEVMRSLETRSTLGFVNRYRHKNGSYRTIEWRAAVTDSGEIYGMGRDITEQRRLEQSLADITEDERNRFWRDLHDGVCQQLTGLRMIAGSLRPRLPNLDTETVQRLRYIEDIADSALSATRQITSGLEVLPDKPSALVTALRDLASRVTDLHGIPCRFISRKNVLVNDADTANQVFLIAQEAVANAARHAKPSLIKVSLTERNGSIRLTVTDDGTGIPKRKRKGGMGLRIMESRATLIGGAFAIKPGKEHGTAVSCSWKRQ